jgi:diaminohydroxyphosphoribosylaminopyrimidine deaminase/5-amino-6-(5-phosphoribosylamino)uracil reductase
VEHLIVGDGPLVALGPVLDHLGDRGINNLLVEGGSRLHGAFFDAGLVDRVAAFVAPVIVGGGEAPGPVGGCGVATMAAAWRLVDVTLRRLGDDLLLEGSVRKPGSDRDVA